MNEIILKGVIRNIQPSHTIGDVEYEKADLIVTRGNGKEDILNLRFKKYSNPFKDNQLIELIGNVRSYSREVRPGKNKVDIYVFTYFDVPPTDSDDKEILNSFRIDGRICKIDDIRLLNNGTKNIHLILANNLDVSGGQKLNSYLPCVAWDGVAKRISNLSVNDKIEIIGELHSREYKKTLENGEMEIRVAQELVITDFQVID